MLPQPTHKTVTIVMATYNGEFYIAEQVHSLLQQTYPISEIIIVDDASTDNTLTKLQLLQANSSYVTLLQNPTNLGITKTFEKAISLCKSDYIAICDQDDVWEHHKIATLINAIGSEDAIYSNSLLVNNKNESLGIKFDSLLNMQSYYTGLPFLVNNCVPGHTILMKTAFIQKILPIPSNIMYDRWIGYCAAASNGLAYINQTLVRYRQHANNAIGTHKSTKAKVAKQNLYTLKKAELETMATAPITSVATQNALQEMINLFHKKWSLQRSLFFFKHINTILVIKKKPMYRKYLYCIKMFFKPNY